MSNAKRSAYKIVITLFAYIVLVAEGCCGENIVTGARAEIAIVAIKSREQVVMLARYHAKGRLIHFFKPIQPIKRIFLIWNVRNHNQLMD